MKRLTFLALTVLAVTGASFGQQFHSGFNVDGTLAAYRSSSGKPEVQPMSQVNIWQDMYRGHLFIVGRISLNKPGAMNAFFTSPPSGTLVGLTWQPTTAFGMRGLGGMPGSGRAMGELSLWIGPESRWIELSMTARAWRDTTTDGSATLGITFQPMRDFKVGVEYYSYITGALSDDWLGGNLSYELRAGNQTSLVFHASVLTQKLRQVPYAGITYVYEFN